MSSDDLQRRLERSTPEEVTRALDHDRLDDGDVATLLSPAAIPFLEEMARQAQALTRLRFGCTMQLYAPIYLSNECVNRCTYCGFSHELGIPRLTLTTQAVMAEAERLHAQGFRHLLLVSGEAPRTIDVRYLAGVARALRPGFASLSIEAGTFDLDGYRQLAAAGVDGLVLYQETYQPEVYRRVHPAGPKHDFGRRLRAVALGGAAGFRSLGIGALLGLAPWRRDALALLQHGRELGRQCWRSRIAVSFPRMRDHAGGRAPEHPVSDRELVQMICTARLALPDAELVLSTREPAHLRDCLMGIGITRMSAGSRTSPGGYGTSHGAGEQFAIADDRSPAEVAAALLARGFEPVWKDLDRALVAQPEGA